MILDLRESDEIPDLKPLLQKSSTCLFLWKIPSFLSIPENNFLSVAELAKLQTLQIPERRRQYLASRYFTKTLLSSFLGVSAFSFQFDFRGEGKLTLPQKVNSFGLDFNFSHTDELFFLGVSKSHDIGVDLEAKIDKKNLSQIAEKIFSQQERLWIGASQDRFFRLWSLKEAVIKAAAGGVFKHAQDIEFSSQAEILSLSKIPKDFGALSKWQTFENPVQGFSCAWALRARD